MGKLTRNKVIINKTSLEVLDDLNKQAEKVDCVVVVGVLSSESSMLGGKTSDPVPFYMVLEQNMFKEGLDNLEETHIGLNKEDVLRRLIGLAKTKGE